MKRGGIGHNYGKDMAPAAIGLLLGLLFVVGGFGAFVGGHLEGLLIIFVGMESHVANPEEGKRLQCTGIHARRVHPLPQHFFAET